MFRNILDSWKQKRIRVLEDRIDDERSYLNRWSFGMKPSEIRLRQQRLFDWEQQYIDLTGDER